MTFMAMIWCAVLCALPILVVGETAKELESLVDFSGLFFKQDGCPYLESAECPNSNISYYLYTRETQNSPYQLDPSKPETIKNAKFISGVPLKVIIHGYTGHKDFAPNLQLRPAYFKKGEYNIISIDWGKLAPAPCYYEAAENVKFVAQCAAQLLDTLVQTRSEVDLSITHIIGFSLGAHVAGLMAANLSTGVVPRVTGLDPALPMFDITLTPESAMIRANVAEFVDIYHSNIGLQGKRATCGVADVYLNNGTSQPGCNCSGTCDHLRAVNYFAESINSEIGLWGFLCDSWSSYVNGACEVNSTDELVRLGDSISSEGGVFLALTNSKSPYLLPPSVIVEDGDLPQKVTEDCALDDYL